MDLPLEQPTTNDIAADIKLPGPPTPIRCKHCNRRFATISVEGDLIPFTHQEQACAFCDPFLAFYETLQVKEREHTALLDRGPKHHGRALAHEKYRNARVALENFLIAVEAPNEASFNKTQADFANRVDEMQLKHTDAPRVENEHRVDQQTLNGGTSPTRDVSPGDSSLTAKRKVPCKSDALSLERKRIKFTEAVEERPQYRSTLEFNRGAKEYVPGRYVAAEGSEFLDTSGSTISFAKFTGQKKMGSRFVDIIPKEGAEEGEGGPSAKLKRGHSQSKKTRGGQPHEQPEQTGSQLDGREWKALGRSRSATSLAMLRPRRDIARYDGNNDGPMRDWPGKKLPSFTVTDAVTDKQQTKRASKHTEGCHWSRVESDHNNVAKEATEAASIEEILINIQRELSHLQNATVSSRYKDLVSAAVRGFADLLVPLTSLTNTDPDPTKDTETAQVEVAVSVKSLNKTNHEASSEISHPVESPEESHDVLSWSQAPSELEELHKADVSLPLDVNAPDDVHKKDSVDTLAIPALETARKSIGTRTYSSVEAAVEETSLQAPESNPFTESPSTANTSSEVVRHSSAQAHGRVEANSKPMELIARMSSTAPPIVLEPSFKEGERFTRPSAKTTMTPQVALSQQAPPPLFTVVSTLDEAGGWHDELNDNIECSSKSIHVKATHIPESKDAKGFTTLHEPLPRSITLTANGDDTRSLYDYETAQKNTFIPIEPTLASLPVQPSCIEAAGSVRQSFGELNNKRNEKLGPHAQSESEPSDEDQQY